jgi:glucokinase
MLAASRDNGNRPERGGVSVGVDIGGTDVKIGAVGNQGRILARATLPFRAFAGFDDFVDALAQAILHLGSASGHKITAIGVASPGHPDPHTGRIADGGYNVAILQEQSLLTALRAHGLPAVLALNDGVAAAIGEQEVGAARGLRNFALLTLGTGVGGCVMIDGRPVIGAAGDPPELGAMVLDLDGPLCGNGLAGTLEAYASASGFASAYALRGGSQTATPAAIFAAAQAGDAVALAAIDSVCRRIAQALGSLINALNLQACLLGGGISQGGPLLLDGVTSHLRRTTWKPLLDNTRILLAGTGNDAGLLGAAFAARKHIAAPGA